MRILHGGTAAVILAFGCSTPPVFEVVRGSDSRQCAREARPAVGCADLAIIVDASRSTIDLLRDAEPRRSGEGELVQEADSILAAELAAIEFLLGRIDAKHQTLSIIACGGLPPRDVPAELRDAGAAETWIQVGLTNDTSAVRRGVAQIWSRGSSASCNLGWAIALAWEILRPSPSAFQAVLFLTDGHLIEPLGVQKHIGSDGKEVGDLSANWLWARPRVETLRAAGVRFGVLAVKPTVELSGAAALVGDGGGSLREASDFEGARWALVELAAAAGQAVESAERPALP